MEGGGEAEVEDKRAIPAAAADLLENTAANAPGIIIFCIASTLRCDEHTNEVTSLKLFCPISTALLENIRRTATFMAKDINDDIVVSDELLNGSIPIPMAHAVPNKL
jgi:hypothetical protein